MSAGLKVLPSLSTHLVVYDVSGFGVLLSLLSPPLFDDGPAITADSKNVTPASVDVVAPSNNVVRIAAAPLAYMFWYASNVGFNALYVDKALMSAPLA